MISNVNKIKINCIELRLIKTNCNHYYHLECLLASFKANKKSHNNVKECPYCRSATGYIPKTDTNPIYKIHKEADYSSIYSIRRCTALLKSGKRKGLVCGCIVRNENNTYCGKHKNYIPPPKIQPNIEKKEENKNWFKNKVLLTYY